MANPGQLDVAHLTSRLSLPPRSWTSVQVFDELGSTNALAMERGQAWEVLVTEHQSAGRGRLDRSWGTPAGTSLTFSATVPAPVDAVGWLPLIAGLAVAEAVQALTGLRAALKWPNDVLLTSAGNRKVCGILCEYRPASEPTGALVVVGIGINISQTRVQLPVATATSLALAGAGDVDREDLLVTVLDRFATRYAALRAGGPAADGVRAAYRSACVTVGTRVRLERPGREPCLADAVDLDHDGALIVDDGSGRVRYAAGDVTHLRPASDDGGLA
jgi:BirA family biotin operon repressor/biotin-[acetyl-CoA-carboxylase] ligase